MSNSWQAEAEIEYCVPCGYANLASYMASELFQAAGPALAISIKPGDSGVFTVKVNGDVLWDKKKEGRSPHIMEVKDIKAKVINIMKSLSAA